MVHKNVYAAAGALFLALALVGLYQIGDKEAASTDAGAGGDGSDDSANASHPGGPTDPTKPTKGAPPTPPTGPNDPDDNDTEPVCQVDCDDDPCETDCGDETCFETCENIVPVPLGLFLGATASDCTDNLVLGDSPDISAVESCSTVYQGEGAASFVVVAPALVKDYINGTMSGGIHFQLTDVPGMQASLDAWPGYVCEDGEFQNKPTWVNEVDETWNVESEGDWDYGTWSVTLTNVSEQSKECDLAVQYRAYFTVEVSFKFPEADPGHLDIVAAA